MDSPRDVRLSPNSGGIADIAALRVCARTGLGEVKRSPCGLSAINPSVITTLSLFPFQPNRERLTIFIKKARARVIQTRRRQGEDDIMLTRRGFAGFASCAI